MRIIDQVLMSEYEQVKVNVISPSLAVSVAPSGGAESTSKEKGREREKMLQKVAAVEKGIVPHGTVRMSG